MYHSHDDTYPGYVFNGKHVNKERRPGNLQVHNGRFVSGRLPPKGREDRIWWDTSGHNSGANVYVTKEGGYEMSDPRSLASPGRGVYYSSYRTTPPISVD